MWRVSEIKWPKLIGTHIFLVTWYFYQNLCGPYIINMYFLCGSHYCSLVTNYTVIALKLVSEMSSEFEHINYVYIIITFQFAFYLLLDYSML